MECRFARLRPEFQTCSLVVSCLWRCCRLVLANSSWIQAWNFIGVEHQQNLVFLFPPLHNLVAEVVVQCLYWVRILDIFLSQQQVLLSPDSARSFRLMWSVRCDDYQITRLRFGLCNCLKLQRPSPPGSVPLSVIRAVHFPVATVRVPPGLCCNGNLMPLSDPRRCPWPKCFRMIP